MCISVAKRSVMREERASSYSYHWLATETSPKHILNYLSSLVDVFMDEVDHLTRFIKCQLHLLCEVAPSFVHAPLEARRHIES